MLKINLARRVIGKACSNQGSSGCERQIHSYLNGKINFFVTQLIVLLETYHPTKLFFLLITNVRFGFFLATNLGSDLITSIMIIFFVTKLIASLETNHSTNFFLFYSLMLGSVFFCH